MLYQEYDTNLDDEWLNSDERLHVLANPERVL